MVPCSSTHLPGGGLLPAVQGPSWEEACLFPDTVCLPLLFLYTESESRLQVGSGYLETPPRRLSIQACENPAERARTQPSPGSSAPQVLCGAGKYLLTLHGSAVPGSFISRREGGCTALLAGRPRLTCCRNKLACTALLRLPHRTLWLPAVPRGCVSQPEESQHFPSGEESEIGQEVKKKAPEQPQFPLQEDHTQGK